MMQDLVYKLTVAPLVGVKEFQLAATPVILHNLARLRRY